MRRLNGARSTAVVAVGAVMLAALGGGALAQQGKNGTGGGMPANKVVAAGSELEKTGANEAPIQLLSQRMRVSSPADLMLHVSAECSILTALKTGGSNEGGATDSALAEGEVKLWLTIDGTVVPVSADDATETGKVVFCNREYQRSVTDHEGDGLDEEEDYIRTRSANAFNWFALDTGFAFDDPANGKNVLDIVLWGEFTREPVACADTPPFGTCAEAFVGHRTLIVEPTHAAVGEQVDGAPAEEATE